MKYPEDFDKLLFFLIDNVPVDERLYDLNMEAMSKETGLSQGEIVSLVKHFMKEGFVSAKFGAGRSTNVLVQPAALQFKHNGGYTAKERILNTELKLLQEQVKSLEKKLSIQDFESITNVVEKISKALTAVFLA